MSIQLSEAQLKSAARAATWEQIKVMYEPELEQYASEREKAIRIDEVKSIDLRRYNSDPTSSFALPLANYIGKRVKELQDK